MRSILGKKKVLNSPDPKFTAKVAPIALSQKNYSKIFCIGFNKTGTTTLGEVLRGYGFRTPDQPEQEIRLTKQCFETNYTELIQFVSQYDAFQDLPFSQGSTFVAADALFPNSRFILSERPAEEWFCSMLSYHRKLFGIEPSRPIVKNDVIEKFNYLYPGYSHANKVRMLSVVKDGALTVDWSKLYDKDYYVQQYEQRNSQIKKYFANAPEKLLVLDVTASETTVEICRFLNIPEEYAIKMPRANTT